MQDLRELTAQESFLSLTFIIYLTSVKPANHPKPFRFDPTLRSFIAFSQKLKVVQRSRTNLSHALRGCPSLLLCSLANTSFCVSQALNLDSDSNLWVAGHGHVSKLFTDPASITAVTGGPTIAATLAGAAITLALSTSSTSDPIALNLAADSTLIAACATNPTDGCCTAGNFDIGIAITRNVVASGASFKPSDLNTVYVANSCDTGLVSS